MRRHSLVPFCAVCSFLVLFLARLGLFAQTTGTTSHNAMTIEQVIETRMPTIPHSRWRKHSKRQH